MSKKQTFTAIIKNAGGANGGGALFKTIVMVKKSK